MSKSTLLQIVILFGLCIAGVAPTTQAQAQLYETFVSAAGQDTNACTRAAPCATFAGALGKTAAGGQIVVVDAGNYGAVIINKSISIVNGTNGSATISYAPLCVSGCASTAYITINAGASDVVSLRGLTIRNLPGFPNAFGVLIQSAQKVIIDDCVIGQHTTGVDIQAASGVQTKVYINRTQIEKNDFGITADGSGGGTIGGEVRDSVVSGNTNNGITVYSTGSSVTLVVQNTSIAGNAYGLAGAGSGAGMLVTRSAINYNGTGVFGPIFSYGDNNLNGNGADGAFAVTIGLR
jgi:hypothetical protein